MIAARRTRSIVSFDVFGAPDVLSYTESDAPALAPGEVRIAVDGIGVNFADTMVRRGEYRRGQPLPDIPGMEVAGAVVESSSARHPVGSRVAVFMENGGGYTSEVVADGSLVFPVPDLPGHVVAGSFLQGVTAWFAVRRYGLVSPGQTVLVTGAAGGLGALSIQLAIECGARAIGTASSASKRQFVLDQGAMTAVDPDPSTLASAVREHAPRGVDVVLDAVGGPLFQPALSVLAQNGRYVVVGSASQKAAVFDARHLLPRGQTVCGFVVRNVMDIDPAEPTHALRQVLSRLADGRLRHDVRIMALSAAAEAHRLLEAREVTGKIVLVP